MSKVNAWKYGREVYLIGRSHKFRYLTEEERTVVIEFIKSILPTRKGIADRLNLKLENVGKELEKQNSYSLLKMVQVIGRNFKVQFPTEEEKTLCDTLIEKLMPRSTQGYSEYVCDKVVVEEDGTEEQGTEEDNGEQQIIVGGGDSMIEEQENESTEGQENETTTEEQTTENTEQEGQTTENTVE